MHLLRHAEFDLEGLETSVCAKLRCSLQRCALRRPRRCRNWRRRFRRWWRRCCRRCCCRCRLLGETAVDADRRGGVGVEQARPRREGCDGRGLSCDDLHASLIGALLLGDSARHVSEYRQRTLVKLVWPRLQVLGDWVWRRCRRLLRRRWLRRLRRRWVWRRWRRSLLRRCVCLRWRRRLRRRYRRRRWQRVRLLLRAYPS